MSLIEELSETRIYDEDDDENGSKLKEFVNKFRSTEQFFTYIRDQVKIVSSQINFKIGSEELNAYKKGLHELKLIDFFLRRETVIGAFGESSFLRNKILAKITNYEEVIKQRETISDSHVAKQEKIAVGLEELVKASIELYNWLSEKEYAEAVVQLLAMNYGEEKGIIEFNNKYSSVLGLEEWSKKRYLPMPDKRICNFTRECRASISQTCITIESYELKEKTRYGSTIGKYKITTSLRKKDNGEVKRAEKDTVRVEAEYSPETELQRTNYNLLRIKNEGKDRDKTVLEISSDFSKILDILNEAVKKRLPRQDISKQLAEKTRLVYMEKANIDTDHFEIRNNFYTLRTEIRAIGSPQNHKASVKIEYTKNSVCGNLTELF